MKLKNKILSILGAAVILSSSGGFDYACDIIWLPGCPDSSGVSQEDKDNWEQFESPAMNILKDNIF